MIEHTPDNAPPRPPRPCGVWVKMEDDDVLRGRFKQVPHECGNPKCKGNINRRKLELWPELLDALHELVPTAKLDRATADDIAQVIAEAEEVAGEA